ncbi:MAG: pyridoxamine 5'-phosphate oxidase family protein [Armatimonadetes bacterium]|nr:pyridoxamine 5'-phosphate oxidase family protein [Armatimonadota bacterium]
MPVPTPDTIYEQIREVKDGGKLVMLATASLEGKPNIAPMRFARRARGDVLVIADMYFCKTRVNLKENPNVALSVAFPQRAECPYVVHGQGHLAEKGSPGRLGELWDQWRDWGERNPPTEVPQGFGPPNPSCRAVLVIDAEDITSSEASSFGEQVTRT